MSPAIRFVGDMSRLEVRPGDVFVLQCDEVLSVEASLRLKDQVSEALDGAKVIVLGRGMKLGVAGPVKES